jgi:hypothetical protein
VSGLLKACTHIYKHAHAHVYANNTQIQSHIQQGNDHPSSSAATQALRAENGLLRERLAAVEEAAADALGELEDLQVCCPEPDTRVWVSVFVCGWVGVSVVSVFVGGWVSEFMCAEQNCLRYSRKVIALMSDGFKK